MVSPYHSSYSTFSASAEPAEPAHIDNTSRLRFRSSKDKFLVSQNRTRLPSSKMPRHESSVIPTAADLVAAQPGTSRSHQAGRSTSDSMSEIVGPAPSASRETGDLTQLRTQIDQTTVDRQNAGTRGMISNPNSRIDDKRREAMEIPQTDQDLIDFSVPLRSGSSSSDNFSRVGSKGSTSTSNRDFSGSSSSSEVGLATKALQEFNEYARHYDLSLLEDEESDKPEPSSQPQKRASRLRKSASHAQMAISSALKKAIKRTKSKANLQKGSLENTSSMQEGILDPTSKAKKGILDGRTIEELCKAGEYEISLPEVFSTGPVLVPTFLRNLILFILDSPDKRRIFREHSENKGRLYDYFASLLPKADDMEMYEQGAASTALPQHIQFDQRDAAGCLSKVACGLPCGILGTLSLYNAIRSVHDKLYKENPVQRRLQPKLVALAISSIKSSHCKSFMIAFLGLGSMIAYETHNAANKDLLLDFKGLAKMLAPSLLGLKMYETIKDEQNGSLGDKCKDVGSVVEMLITIWPRIVQHLKAIESGKFPSLHRDQRLASDQSRSSGRLPRLEEYAEPDKDSRPAREEPLQHGHQVNRRIVSSSRAESSAQGAMAVNSRASVQQYSDSSVGHRQLLQHPHFNDPQEQPERRFGDNQYPSAQSNKRNVQTGNNRGLVSSETLRASPGAASSSLGGSARHHSGSSVGHRQLLQHPDFNDPQEQSDRRFGGNQYPSAQSNKRNVHTGNNRGVESSETLGTSPGAAFSSLGVSARHHSGSSVGHRQPLQHPDFNDPQEQSDRRFGGNQYPSGQSNKRNFHTGNNRGLESSETLGTSPGAVSSSLGVSERHRAGSSVGHRQLLQHAYRNNSQEHSEEGYRGNQYSSAPRNERYVQTGNNRRPAPSSKKDSPRYHLDGQREEEFGHDQSLLPPNESGFLVDNNPRAVFGDHIPSRGRTSLTVNRRVLSRTGETDSFRPGSDPTSLALTGLRSSSATTTQRDRISSPVQHLPRQRPRAIPGPSDSHFPDESRDSTNTRRMGMASIEPGWYGRFTTTNQAPWAHDSAMVYTQPDWYVPPNASSQVPSPQRSTQRSSPEDGETGLTGSHVEGTPEIAASSDTENHTVVTTHSLDHDHTASTSTSAHATHVRLAQGPSFTPTTRQISVRELAQRYETAQQRQTSSNSAPGVNTATAATATASTLTAATTAATVSTGASTVSTGASTVSAGVTPPSDLSHGEAAAILARVSIAVLRNRLVLQQQPNTEVASLRDRLRW